MAPTERSSRSFRSPRSSGRGDRTTFNSARMMLFLCGNLMNPPLGNRNRGVSMEMFSSAERLWNESERLGWDERNQSSEGTEQDNGEHNYYAMLYSLLILAIVERSLQTTTNYLVVSLAVADLLVALLVMPWAVYLEVVGGAWLFSRLYCNIFVTLDVMMWHRQYPQPVCESALTDTLILKLLKHLVSCPADTSAIAASVPNKPDDPMFAPSPTRLCDLRLVVVLYCPASSPCWSTSASTFFLRRRRRDRIAAKPAERSSGFHPAICSGAEKEPRSGIHELTCCLASPGPHQLSKQTGRAPLSSKAQPCSHDVCGAPPKTGPVENSGLPRWTPQNYLQISHALRRTELDLERGEPTALQSAVGTK
ncbi:unnamed protein product [Pleuronectes platessa]|uniref:G-protein coupled receptors family 1 profile domain-containing protein n=1 Tax=Pleuronectes platessa TaxID=8262 RepID=A0A9N7YLA0_PLEPL|nr:unnamed protein product [Pleuronectes platessa]